MSDDIADTMVDLESLGIQPTSAIIQIGACTIDERYKFLASIDRDYYEKMHLDRDFRFTYDDSTVQWWEKQDEKIKESLKLAVYPDIKSALIAFTSWYEAVTRQEEYPKIWANSPAFDLVMLNHAYRVCSMEPPWKFWQERCYRTLKSEFGHFLSKDFDSDLTSHRADHDAIMQSRRLRRILDRISVNE